LSLIVYCCYLCWFYYVFFVFFCYRLIYVFHNFLLFVLVFFIVSQIAVVMVSVFYGLPIFYVLLIGSDDISCKQTELTTFF
jgi:hypothetical protein